MVLTGCILCRSSWFSDQTFKGQKTRGKSSNLLNKRSNLHHQVKSCCTSHFKTGRLLWSIIIPSPEYLLEAFGDWTRHKMNKFSCCWVMVLTHSIWNVYLLLVQV